MHWLSQPTLHNSQHTEFSSDHGQKVYAIGHGSKKLPVLLLLIEDKDDFKKYVFFGNSSQGVYPSIGSSLLKIDVVSMTPLTDKESVAASSHSKLMRP